MSAVDGYACPDILVGATVEIHGLSSESGSRFNGCIGVVTQINGNGRCVVKLPGVETQPVVKPGNLRTSFAQSAVSCFEHGDFVEIVGLNSQRGRFLNGHFGQIVPGAGSGRCLVKISASNQAKAIKESNLLKVTRNEVLSRAWSMLEVGHLYELQRMLRGLPFVPASLTSALTSCLATGTHSEILAETLKLVDAWQPCM